MVCGERTSYSAVHLSTNSRLLAFLERGYLKQVVSLKKTCICIDKDMDIETKACICIDKDMDIETLFFGPIFGNISPVRFLYRQTYLYNTTSNKAKEKLF